MSRPRTARLRLLPAGPAEGQRLLNRHVHDLARAVASGRVRAVLTMTLHHDGATTSYTAGNLSWVEARGLADVLADDVRNRRCFKPVNEPKETA